MMSRLIDILLVVACCLILNCCHQRKLYLESSDDELYMQMKAEFLLGQMQDQNEKAMRFIDMMLAMETNGQKVCLSTEIKLNDEALIVESLIMDLTNGHFAWANNLDTCDYVFHYSHGYMSGTRTHSDMYVEYMSMEDIADSFQGQHHISVSCRVSTYTDTGSQVDFGDYDANWKEVFPSSKRANLDFLSPPSVLTFNGFF